MENENLQPKGMTGIDPGQPIVHELTCACGKVCGTITWPSFAKPDLEKVKAEHTTVCDDCGKK